MENYSNRNFRKKMMRSGNVAVDHFFDIKWWCTAWSINKSWLLFSSGTARTCDLDPFFMDVKFNQNTCDVNFHFGNISLKFHGHISFPSYRTIKINPAQTRHFTRITIYCVQIQFFFFPFSSPSFRLSAFEWNQTFTIT